MVEQRGMKYGGLGEVHHVILNSNGFSNWTVVHEFAHAWDAASGWQLSKDMQKSLGARFDHPILHFLIPQNPAYWYDPGNGPPPCGIDENFNPREDFAESVAAHVDPREAARKVGLSNYPYADPNRDYNYSGFLDTPRGQYIKALMISNP